MGGRVHIQPTARILVRGVNWLGDAVMTTPALLRLRERFPEAHLALLTAEKSADLWLQHPSLNQVLTFARGEGPWSVARRLRSERFDLALVLPNSPRSAFESWLARIGVRIGYARPWRNWLLTQPVPSRPGHLPMRKLSARQIQRVTRNTQPAPHSHAPTLPRSDAPPPPVHQIHDYLHLVATLGANPAPLPPQLAVTSTELEAAATKFKLPKPNAGTGPLLGLNPGAEYGPAKRWPLERFIAVAREVHARTNCTWLLLGGPSDVPAARALEAALHTQPSSPAPRPSSLLFLAGQTTLRELMALLKLCRVLLTNDTGPMHLAAALGTPVVAPFGSTSPELTGPGLPSDARHRLLRSQVPCSPCFRRTCPIDFRCMTGISAEQVVKAVLEITRP